MPRLLSHDDVDDDVDVAPEGGTDDEKMCSLIAFYSRSWLVHWDGYSWI